MVPEIEHVSLFDRSCPTVISGDSSLSGSCCPLSKIGVSYAESLALAYRSSCFMMTSASGFFL